MDDFVLNSSATESGEMCITSSSSEDSEDETISSGSSSDRASATETQGEEHAKAEERHGSTVGSASMIHSATMIFDSAKKSLSLARRSSLV